MGHHFRWRFAIFRCTLYFYHQRNLIYVGNILAPHTFPQKYPFLQGCLGGCPWVWINVFWKNFLIKNTSFDKRYPIVERQNRKTLSRPKGYFDLLKFTIIISYYFSFHGYFDPSLEYKRYMSSYRTSYFWYFHIRRDWDNLKRIKSCHYIQETHWFFVLDLIKAFSSSC